MAASSRAQVLDLYRAMLRESKRFGAYNYRTYAIRRIRDAFRENKNVKDPVEIQALVNKAKRDLGIIRRQFSKRMILAQDSDGSLLTHSGGLSWSQVPPLVSHGSTVSPGGLGVGLTSEGPQTASVSCLSAAVEPAWNSDVNAEATRARLRRSLGVTAAPGLPASSPEVHIGQMYSTDKLVIENQEKPRA
ncbi:LYR motif-containing protein 4 isoform 1-T1 [Dama dama]|uniref:LYR motif-containing protein 4 isoform X1 n=1 Tax=Dama dama TaxID=30532 RepID=UPI002A364FAD|nr:LYR motif-containing protein 4 isoform X1 [Dama dama]